MKKLLYIPTSKYINCLMTFDNDTQRLIEDADIFKTRFDFLTRLVEGKFAASFYRRHHITLPAYEEEFVIVEDGEEINEKTTLSSG